MVTSNSEYNLESRVQERNIELRKQGKNFFDMSQGKVDIVEIGSMIDDSKFQRMVNVHEERDFSYGLLDFLQHEQATNNKEISYIIQEPIQGSEDKTYFIENLPNLRRVYAFENSPLRNMDENFDSTSNLMSMLRCISEENGINSFNRVSVYHTNSDNVCHVYFPKRK